MVSVGPGSVGEVKPFDLLWRTPSFPFDLRLGLSFGLRGIRAGFVLAFAARIGVVQMKILSHLVRYVVSGFPGGVSLPKSFPKHEIMCGVVFASTFQQPLNLEQLSLVLRLALRVW